MQTVQQFLALRSLFGALFALFPLFQFFFGGGAISPGLAASTVFDNLPVGLRGLTSGVLQQGYAVRYLTAAVISFELVPTVHVGWRSLFWTSSGISLFGARLRALLPESTVFARARLAAESHRIVSEAQKTCVFRRETDAMLKQHWALCVYTVLLMTGFNFLSQALYPTYMEKFKGFSTHLATIATIVGNCSSDPLLLSACLTFLAPRSHTHAPFRTSLAFSPTLSPDFKSEQNLGARAKLLRNGPCLTRCSAALAWVVPRVPLCLAPSPPPSF
ncbi:hypothetical protein K438DRAFT_1994258 [Mycena galopus ATCC 62051]|nr:hypothetical protein K438DRAFT_1994258 [Mycena galopus ATCC 62051]